MKSSTINLTKLSQPQTYQLILLERSFLSLVMRRPSLLFDYNSSILSFYYPKHQLIWQAMLNLGLKGKGDFDDLIIASHLEKKNQLKDAGGFEYITQVFEAAAVNANIKTYFYALKEYQLNYKFTQFLKTSLDKASQDGFFSWDDVSNQVETFLNELDILKTSLEDNNSALLSVRLNSYFEKLNHNLKLPKDERQKASYIKTGFAKFDKSLGGLALGKLCILGARPGVGKTTLAINLMLNHIKDDSQAAVFASFEQSFDQLATKMLSIMTQISLQKIASFDLTAQQSTMLKNAANSLESNQNLHFIDGTNLDNLLISIKRLKLKHPEISLVIVDYLGLIDVTNKKDKLEQINYAALCFKNLAKNLNLSLLLVSGLKKEVLSNPQLPLNIGHCEYLSAHHGDMYIMLSQPAMQPSSFKNILKYDVPKNKEGPLLSGKLMFNKLTQHITEF